MFKVRGKTGKARTGGGEETRYLPSFGCTVFGKHTCPREAAAVGNVAKEEKIRLVGQPNSSSIICMAFLLSKAGIWSCSFSSSFR